MSGSLRGSIPLTAISSTHRPDASHETTCTIRLVSILTEAMQCYGQVPSTLETSGAPSIPVVLTAPYRRFEAGLLGTDRDFRHLVRESGGGEPWSTVARPEICDFCGGDDPQSGQRQRLHPNAHPPRSVSIVVCRAYLLGLAGRGETQARRSLCHRLRSGAEDSPAA